MIVLTRRAGEAIYASDNITVTIFAITDSQVGVGITAPRNYNSSKRHGIRPPITTES